MDHSRLFSQRRKGVDKKKKKNKKKNSKKQAPNVLQERFDTL